MKRKLAAILSFVLVFIACLPGFQSFAETKRYTVSDKFSYRWYQTEDDVWHIEKDGVLLKNTWILDDECDIEGGLWYLIDEKGDMVSDPMIVDGHGRYYSFQQEHDGHFGTMHVTDGVYYGVNLKFSKNHDGSYGAITNPEGIEALKAKTGVRELKTVFNPQVVKLSEGKKTAYTGSSDDPAPAVKYFTLSYDLNGVTPSDAERFKSVKLKEAEEITKPATPSDADDKKEFVSWYGEDGMDYDFDTTCYLIFEDTTLFARWKEKEIPKGTMVITANDSSKEYDGTPLTDSGYTYTQGVLIQGDELIATVSGTITNAGTVANKVTSYKITRGGADVTSQYTVETEEGTLTVEKAKQPAPVSLAAESPSIKGTSDGKITGTDTTMEYSKDNGTVWTSCNGSEITGLKEKDKVLVRYKETTNYKSGESKEITVPELEEFTISFNGNEGSGSMESRTTQDWKLKLPENGFTAPTTDKSFNGWGIGDPLVTPTAVGETVAFTEDTTVYAIWKKTDCLATGTRITMADGSLKTIEDITEGDKVLTFNHEKGVYEAQKVYLAWKCEEPKCAFTLNFTNGIHLSVVGDHNLFEKESLTYAAILESNAEEYVGRHFYNAADGRYEELLSVTYGTEPVEYYEIYTEYNANCIAESMLNVPFDASEALNIYKFHEDLSIDHELLSGDITEYGLLEYPENAAYSRELFDAMGWKYVNIMIGKGFGTWEDFLARRDEYLNNY